jgi:hypothetical protein
MGWTPDFSWQCGETAGRLRQIRHALRTFLRRSGFASVWATAIDGKAAAPSFGRREEWPASVCNKTGDLRKNHSAAPGKLLT